MIYEIFPEEYVQLDRELSNGLHPKLEAILSRFGPEDLDMKIAQICAYCGIELDGIYTLEARIKICEMCRLRLITLREAPPTIFIN